MRPGVNPCVRKISRRRKWQPTPVFLPGKIPWTEEPGRLQSMGSQRVRHDFTFTFHFHTLEKEMAPHSSVLAWRIPGTGEPGGLLSMGSHRVRHDWSDLAAVAARIFSWRIPWTEELVKLQSRGSQRVRHDWATNTHTERRRIQGCLYFHTKGCNL